MGGLTVARDGKVIYSRSFGYRQISDTQRQPLAADTKYRIASITKTLAHTSASKVATSLVFMRLNYTVNDFVL
jgi:CubicO group peptidase (beta-lactamase class C family)